MQWILAANAPRADQKFRYLRPLRKVSPAAVVSILRRVCRKCHCNHLGTRKSSMADQGLSGGDHTGARRYGTQLDWGVCAGDIRRFEETQEMRMFITKNGARHLAEFARIG